MTGYGKVKKGYEYPAVKFVVISESDIFGSEKKKKKRHRMYEGEKIASFTDLNIGDYVVHENHGLGIYRGIEKIEVDKTVKDYIKIEYAGGGNLYILAYLRKVHPNRLPPRGWEAQSAVLQVLRLRHGPSFQTYSR